MEGAIESNQPSLSPRLLVNPPVWLAVPLALLTTQAAFADGEQGLPFGQRRFTDPGVLIFAVNAGVGGSQAVSQDFETLVETHFGPSLDVFFARGFTWGLGMQLSRTFARVGGGESLVEISPRLGWTLPIGDALVFWPRAGLGLAEATVDAQVPQSSGASSYVTFHHRIVSVTAYAPLHLFVLPHILVGFGPTFQTQLVHRTDEGASARLTNLGADFEIAGWL